MERRYEGRLLAILQGFCELPTGSRQHVQITNLSTRGCGLKGELDVAAGEQVRLSVAGIGPLVALVEWADGRRAGIALAEALDPELVSHLAAC
jgi:hypothetical protein